MPDLSDTVKQLIGQYHSLKNVRKGFDKDPSPNNVDVRSNIPGPDGQPAFSLSAGTADALLKTYETRNLEMLSQHADSDSYNEFRSSVLDNLSSNGRANAYTVLIKDHADIRQKLIDNAFKRVASKNKLDEKIKEKDPGFDSKTDDEKLEIYKGKISEDEELAKKLGEDASYNVAKYLQTVYLLEEAKSKGKELDSVSIIDSALETNIASLLRNEGQLASVKALTDQALNAMYSKAIKLIAENDYVAKDVDNSLGSLENGYARAIADLYPIYDLDSEKKFRKGYDKAKADGEVTNIADYKAKLKEKQQAEEKESKSLFKKKAA